MIEQEVEIPSGNIHLKAVLCLPAGAGPFPSFLYVSGSGPIDRNDNIPGQLLNNSRLISDYLTEKGIACLRYDKRGVGESGGDYNSAGHHDLVMDAAACARFLLNHSAVKSNKVFVAGHSEGSIIAPQVALQVKHLAGIILLSPFCNDMESILMEQARQLKKMVREKKGLKVWFWKVMATIWDPVKSQSKLIRKLKSSDKEVIRSGFQKVPARWFRELFALDVEKIYRTTTVPALIIGGEKDFQCDPADVGKIKKIIGGEVEAHVIPNMSHLLRKEEGEPSIFNYGKQLDQSILPDVLDLIGNWLDHQVSR